MVDDAGIRIVTGFDVSIEHDLVVASSVGSVEIMAVHKGQQGLVVTALVRDASGNVIDPPDGSLAIYRTGGERLCFTEEVINNHEVTRQAAVDENGHARVPMSFVLLLDRSGSMKPHINEVQRAAHGFLDALPENAVCSVGAFSDTSASFEPSDGFGFRRECRAGAFTLDGLEDAGGGTNLYRPLENAYRWLDAWHSHDEQRLVIMITDGKANQELEREDAVRAAKGNIRTFVFHVGGQEERFLSSLADSYLAHKGDLEDSLTRYFEVVSETYTSQTVLRLNQCMAEGH
jgi:Mg-chelatase subunit ChlD